MEKNNTVLLQKLWERGETIEAAINRYYAGISKMEYPEVLKSKPTILEGIEAIKNILVQPLQAKLNAKNQFRDDLFKNKIVGLGFKTADKPVQIPYHIWPDAEINWEKSTVKFAELEFLSVRIISSKIIQFQKLNKPGRPSRRPDIRKAIQKLIKNGRLNEKKSLKFQLPLIQSTIMAISGVNNISGIGYEAVRRVIDEEFPSLKFQNNSKL